MHWFPDPSGHTLRAKDLRGLIDAVASYRAQNGMARGNPEAEIERFYSKQFPWLVDHLPAKADKPNETDALVRWVNQMWRATHPRFHDRVVQSARLAVCRGCPHYSGLPELDNETVRRLMVVGAGAPDFDVGYCSARNWVCGLAALIPDCGSGKLEGCWVGKEIGS